MIVESIKKETKNQEIFESYSILCRMLKTHLLQLLVS